MSPSTILLLIIVYFGILFLFVGDGVEVFHTEESEGAQENCLPAGRQKKRRVCSHTLAIRMAKNDGQLRPCSPGRLKFSSLIHGSIRAILGQRLKREYTQN